MPSVRALLHGESAKQQQQDEPMGRPVMMLVTPEFSAAGLKKMAPNRHVHDPRVSLYAQDITEGRWRRNGESIVFDRDGLLRDGQHRLLACIKAGVPFWSLVVFDADPAECDIFDVGRGKSLGDRLSMLGISHARTVAAALRLLYLYELDPKTLNALWSHGRLPSQQVLVEFSEKHPGIIDSINYFSRSHSGIANPSVIGFTHYVLSRIDSDTAQDFFRDFTTGCQLDSTDPVYRLRERFIRESRGKTIGLHPAEQIALIFKAWNHRRQGNRIQNLVSRRNSPNGARGESENSHSGFPIPI